jgi:hypothetical protein
MLKNSTLKKKVSKDKYSNFYRLNNKIIHLSKRINLIEKILKKYNLYLKNSPITDNSTPIKVSALEDMSESHFKQMQSNIEEKEKFKNSLSFSPRNLRHSESEPLSTRKPSSNSRRSRSEGLGAAANNYNTQSESPKNFNSNSELGLYSPSLGLNSSKGGSKRKSRSTRTKKYKSKKNI